VVEKGACISISSGRMVDVLNFPWILFMANFRPIPNVNLVELPDFSVEDLILPKERVWNKLLLEDLFDPLLIQCILSIHLPVCPTFDKWFWAPASSGLFSMKSDHELEILMGGRHLPFL
jgi:DNA helicase HerA-like ATPase